MCTPGADCISVAQVDPFGLRTGAHLHLLHAHVGAGDRRALPAPRHRARWPPGWRRRSRRPGTTCEAPARISRSRHAASVTRATMRRSGASDRAVSATTAFDGSSRLVISAAARPTPAVRNTVDVAGVALQEDGAGGRRPPSSTSSVGVDHLARAPGADGGVGRDAAHAAEPDDDHVVAAGVHAPSTSFVRGSAALTSPERNSAVSDAAEYTNTANPAKMTAIVHTRPAVVEWVDLAVAHLAERDDRHVDRVEPAPALDDHVARGGDRDREQRGDHRPAQALDHEAPRMGAIAHGVLRLPGGVSPHMVECGLARVALHRVGWPL